MSGSGRTRSRAGAPSGPWTLLRCAPELLLVIVALLGATPWTDPDLWGHLRFGQATLSHLSLIRRDPYSYSAYGHIWRNHEWLSEAIMALVYNAWGPLGLRLWKLSMAALLVLLLAWDVAQTQASPQLQFCVLAWACAAVAPHMQFRPQLFTLVLFAAELTLLARSTYRAQPLLWPLIPLMALWANLHGGFIVGVGALGLYAGAAIVLFFATGSRRIDPLRVCLVTCAATAATLLTPYGAGTWAAVAHAIGNPLTRSIIDDWKSPLLIFSQRHLGYNYWFCLIYTMALTGVLLMLTGLTPQSDDLGLVAVAGGMIIATFISVRNLPLAAIACIAPIANHAALAQPKLRQSDQTEGRSHFSVATRCLAAAGAAAAALWLGWPLNRLLLDQSYPSAAVAFIKAQKLSGNLLSTYNWGEYLIWHVEPSSRVFIDGRYDTVYPPQVIDDYLAFHTADPNAQRTLRNYPHDFVLVGTNSRPCELMKKLRQWTLIYRDQDSALFARSNSPSAMMHNLPFSTAAAPSLYFPGDIESQAARSAMMANRRGVLPGHSDRSARNGSD